MHQSIQSGYSVVGTQNFQRNMEYIAETAKALARMSKKGTVPPGLDQASMTVLMSMLHIAARMGRQQ
jgi:hypothetical protein